MSTKIEQLFVIVACLGILLVAARAQSDRGTLTGTVIDATGAVLVNVVLTVTEPATGATVRTASGPTGNFTVPVLKAGVYEIKAELAGFQTRVISGVTIQVAQTTHQDVTLEVGEVAQTTEVRAEALLLRPDTSDLGTTISNRQMLDLPLSMQGEQRSPAAFLKLVPGVVGRGGSSSSNPEANFSTAINGGQTLSMEIQLDGAAILNSNLAGDLRILGFPQDAVEEFKLSTNNFAAEFGRTGGGITSFTLKSGTNQLHGSAYEFFRNDKLDSRGFFNAARAVNRQNEFGVTVGGPIRKDRTFFFGFYNGFRYRHGAQNNLATVPLPEMRSGDFSNLRDEKGNVIPIYDPLTTRPDGQGGFTRDQFPGNVIPADHISTVSKNIAQYIPDPTLPGQLRLNFASSVGLGVSTNQYGGKIDHAIGDRHKLSGSFTISKFRDDGTTLFEGPLSSQGGVEEPLRLVRLNYDFIVRPTVFNHFNIGFNRTLYAYGTLNPRAGWPAKIGLKNVAQDGQMPQINLGNGYAQLGGIGEGANAENNFHVSDHVSIISGRHSWKFGAETRRIGDNTRGLNRDSGYFNFSSLETSLPNSQVRSLTGDSFASFLLGALDYGEKYVYTLTPGQRYRYYSVFLEDDFKVSRKLTLNYGLRYEIPFARVEVANRMANFNPSLPNPGAGNRPGAVEFASADHRSFADTDFKEFGPRLGFAYQPFSRTVFRGGYGIYFSGGGAVLGNGHLLDFTLPFNSAPNFASLDTGVTPAFYWDNGFPTNYPQPPFIDPTFGIGGRLNYMAREDAHVPYIQNWNFDIQHQLPGNILIDTAYVGSKGTRLISNLYVSNQLASSYLSLGSLLTADISSPEAQAAGIPLPYPGFTGSVAQALRPFPQFTNITRPFQNAGNSTYHAFQLKIEKRFSHGLTFLTSYTVSKTLTDSEAQIAVPFSSGAQDQFNQKAEKSISLNDYPQNLVWSFSYELPVGPGKPFLNQGGAVGKIMGGWRVTGIAQYQSGSPLNVVADNTLPGQLGGDFLRANVVAGVPKRTKVSPGDFDPARDRWINAEAFSIPAPFTLGNGPRFNSDLRGFAYLNEDLGLGKRTHITENVNVDFRVEFFNAFNRVVFGGPAGNPFLSGAVGNNLSDPTTFGKVGSQANLPRQIQFGLKINY
jgi:hypothetical protein